MKRGFFKSFEFWAALFAFASAICWFWSAYVGLVPFGSLEHGRPNGAIGIPLEKSAYLNAVAALFTGLTAMTMCMSLLLRKKVTQPSKTRSSQRARLPRQKPSPNREDVEAPPSRRDKPEASGDKPEVAIPREERAPRKRGTVSAIAEPAPAKRRTIKDTLAR